MKNYDPNPNKRHKKKRETMKLSNLKNNLNKFKKTSPTEEEQSGLLPELSKIEANPGILYSWYNQR